MAIGRRSTRPSGCHRVDHHLRSHSQFTRVERRHQLPDDVFGLWRPSIAASCLTSTARRSPASSLTCVADVGTTRPSGRRRREANGLASGRQDRRKCASSSSKTTGRSPVSCRKASNEEGHAVDVLNDGDDAGVQAQMSDYGCVVLVLRPAADGVRRRETGEGPRQSGACRGR
jgi:hypothetical protein